MKKRNVRILSLVGLLCLVVGTLVLLEAIVWNKMTITYRCALVLEEENGCILKEEELPPSLLDGWGTQYLALGGESRKVTARDGYGYRFLGWSDGETSLWRRDRTFENKTITAYFTYDTGRLAHLSVEGNTLTVVDTDDSKAILEGTLTKVADKKGYSAYKSTYTLSFAEEQTLLGMTGKDWLFAPAYEDPTLLRDYFSYTFASELLSEQPKGELVILLHEKEYAGVYLLSPKFLPTDLTAIEYGVEEDLSYETLDTAEYGLEEFPGQDFGIPNHVMKIHKLQINYLKIKVLMDLYALVLRYDNERVTGERIDLPSAVDAYIVTELTKNTMAGRRGTFLSYREGKLYFLSETYFSLSGGIDRRYPSADGCVFDYTIENGTVNGYPVYLLAGLATHDWFIDLVKARWQEIGDSVFEKAYNQTVALYERAGAVLSADKAIYPCCSTTDELRVQEWAHYTSEVKQNSYDENVEAYLAWLIERKAYMDKIYG